MSIPRFPCLRVAAPASLALAALVLAGCPAPSPNSTAPVATTAPSAPAGNAAQVYARVYDELGGEEGQFFGVIGIVEDPSALTGMRMNLITRQRSKLSELAEATRLDCDFELDMSGGYATALPHLKMTRWLGQALRADAFRLLNREEPTEAAHRCAAIFRLARHVAQDDLLPARKSAYAIVLAGLKTIEDLDDAGALDAERRAMLRAELDGLDPADPLAASAVLEVERAAAQRMLAGNLGTSAMLGPGWERMSPEDRAEVLAAVDERFVRLIEAWHGEDPLATLQAIEAEPAPTIVRAAVPSLAQYRVAVEGMTTRINEVAARLAAPPATAPAG